MNRLEILRVENLNIHMRTPKGIKHILKDINFSVYEGISLGIVGQSGSGKTLTALAIMGMLPSNAVITSGKVLFMGEDLLAKTQSEMSRIRGHEIAMMFQNPMTALNPVYNIKTQITDVVRRHRKITRKDIKFYIPKLLESVGLEDPESILKKYPHELSGGMLQRILIAMVIACKPRLLIADEPTAALDPTIRNYILDLINDIRKITNMEMIIITHDLSVVKKICTDVIVMNEGRILESGKIIDVFKKPQHEYTKKLVDNNIG